jgi:5-methylcytosine-specific restriction endonuclease McrA
LNQSKENISLLDETKDNDSAASNDSSSRVIKECKRHGLTSHGVYKCFSKDINKIRTHFNCLLCHSERSAISRRISKKFCLEYRGGKCSRCGYKKYQGSLDFHHRNPKEKQGEISLMMRTIKEPLNRSTETDPLKIEFMDELDRCDILCRNCHSEERTSWDEGEYSDNSHLIGIK